MIDKPDYKSPSDLLKEGEIVHYHTSEGDAGFTVYRKPGMLAKVERNTKRKRTARYHGDKQVEEFWCLVGLPVSRLLNFRASTEVSCLWYGRMNMHAYGGPSKVYFEPADIPLEYLVGFAHTHPGSSATPSQTDHDTMHAWVCSLGRPLVCAIRGREGWRAYVYTDDESKPVKSMVKRLGPFLCGVINA
jgi:proteasome lid subunit RPN8/RPN11